MSHKSDRKGLIDGLHAVADFYAAHPEAYDDGLHLTINMYVWSRDAKTQMVATRRAFDTCQKIVDDNNVTISKSFGDRVTLAVFAARRTLGMKLVGGGVRFGEDETGRRVLLEATPVTLIGEDLE